MRVLWRFALPLATLVTLAALLGTTEPRCVPIPTAPDCVEDADCDTGDPCALDFCDATTGTCASTPLPDGTACDDGDLCTMYDVCTAGICEGIPFDDDISPDPCTDIVCDPVLGIYEVYLEWAPCDDGDPCTVDDTCMHGACMAGPPRDCDDGDPCTRDSCEPFLGCVHRLTEDCDGAQPWNCHDAVDNDGDGLVDFDDPDCADVPCCPGPEVCDNGMDDDLDGLVDCADADCASSPACAD